jgi:hypothetical protein
LTTWRYIKNDNVAASAGLAADEVLANCAGADTSQHTLRLIPINPVPWWGDSNPLKMN